MGDRLVIVGGGSAGVVIATRVSEAARREVTLLEAGPDYMPEALPRDLMDGRHNSMKAHDWGYRHRPNSRQVLFPLPRGRVVGGSSAVNTCVALRGQPTDFEEWATRGLDAWTWEQCLPAFKRLERDLDFSSDADNHGAEGPLPISRATPSDLWPWQAAFLDACHRLGFPACDDANRPGSHGAGALPMNRIRGRRISVAEAYLTRAVRKRPSLSVQAHTLVQRVLFRGQRVIGVEVTGPDGDTVIETSQVVLTAGAINTPALLLRSGVGPGAELRRLGVDVVADVPAVGARLLDHPGTAIFLRPRWGSRFSHEAPLLQTALRYGSAGTGQLADIQVQPGSKVNLPGVPLPLVSIMCAVNKPRGTGRLRFTSRDPRAKPLIESRLLHDPRDLSQAVDGMALAFELAQTPEMARLAAPFWPSTRTLRSRARIEEWIHRACDSGYHPSGTVPMGTDDDRDAATDQFGRVRGVQGLLVADASLMPTIVAANIHLTVLAMAERFGEWLADPP